MMVGVKPVADSLGRVNKLEVIPLEELGRPRVDVVVNCSGVFRDLFVNQVSIETLGFSGQGLKVATVTVVQAQLQMQSWAQQTPEQPAANHRGVVMVNCLGVFRDLFVNQVGFGMVFALALIDMCNVV
jgi:hypothetical protein